MNHTTEISIYVGSRWSKKGIDGSNARKIPVQPNIPFYGLKYDTPCCESRSCRISCIRCHLELCSACHWGRCKFLCTSR